MSEDDLKGCFNCCYCRVIFAEIRCEKTNEEKDPWKKCENWEGGAISVKIN
jgi:hypothetical protein